CEVRQSPGVTEQVMYRDLAPRARTIGDVFADWVLYIELAALLQQQDCRGCELLCYRAQPEFSPRGVGHVELDVCHSVAPATEDLSVAGDKRAPAESRLLRHRV